MALYDNPLWLLSHLRNSFSTSDDTGNSERVLTSSAVCGVGGFLARSVGVDSPEDMAEIKGDEDDEDEEEEKEEDELMTRNRSRRASGLVGLVGFSSSGGGGRRTYYRPRCNTEKKLEKLMKKEEQQKKCKEVKTIFWRKKKKNNNDDIYLEQEQEEIFPYKWEMSMTLHVMQAMVTFFSFVVWDNDIGRFCQLRSSIVRRPP